MFSIAMVFAAEWIGGGTRNPEVLVRMGAIIPGIFERGDWWRLVTVMFLHNGVMHLALNLWALYQLGSIFETLFGSARFLFTYALAGLVASVASAALARGVSVGASGAIFGVLGALIFSIRRSPRWRHQPWTRGFILQLLFWAGLNILIGFTVPGIDNAAHLGGFVTGLVLGFLPHRVPPPPPGEGIIEARVEDRTED